MSAVEVAAGMAESTNVSVTSVPWNVALAP
jgi:hypothetical protein